MRLKKRFQNFKVLVNFYRQFPNYSISIQLLNDQSEYSERYLFLTLKISMLTNYFTVFFEEITKHTDIIISPGYAINSTIIFLESQKFPERLQYFEQIKQIVKECFSEYNFVKHYILFSTKVEHGTLYGDSSANEGIKNSLYRYLFDNQDYINLYVTK